MGWPPKLLKKVRRELIALKSDSEIAKMRVAGLIVADALAAVTAAVRPGVSTLELDAIAEDTIRSAGGAPNFMLEPGYFHTLCTSVNDEVVHGIPRADKILAEGDIISIDCGAIIGGWNGDAAVTVPVGAISQEQQDLLTVTEDSMWAGLAAGIAGGRLTDISHAIESCIRDWERKHDRRYGIVDMYGGHGIGERMHEDPFVYNYGPPGRGPKLAPGMALAIEPMVTIGGRVDTKVLSDDWTVVSADGSMAAHFEHSMAITATGPWILTAHDGGEARLADYGVRMSALAG